MICNRFKKEPAVLKPAVWRTGLCGHIQREIEIILVVLVSEDSVEKIEQRETTCSHEDAGKQWEAVATLCVTIRWFLTSDLSWDILRLSCRWTDMGPIPRQMLPLCPRGRGPDQKLHLCESEKPLPRIW